MNKNLLVKDKKTSGQNLERLMIISGDHKIVEVENIQNNINLSEGIKIYFNDNIQGFDLLKLLYLFIKFETIHLHMYSLETYSLSLRAYLSEIFNPNKINRLDLKSYVINPKAIADILLRKIILNHQRSTLSVPSELRRKFINHSKAIIHRNLPTKQWVYQDLSNEIPSKLKGIGNYILLVGRLNCKNSLITINNWAIRKGYKIILCGDHDISGDNYINLGKVSSATANQLIRRSKAGIVLYSSDTINQKLSASSKLYEFLAYNIPVIHNLNTGLEKEIEVMNLDRELLINSDLLCKMQTIPNTKSIINPRLIFDIQYGQI